MAKKTLKAEQPGTYALHRERQRRRILAAAQGLFDERGIDRTTVAEIVAASGVRASTLYEYFSKKDDMVWAILEQVLEADTARTRDQMEQAGTGLEKITVLLESMADGLAKHQGSVRFMAQFDAMYARDWPAERLLMLEGQILEGWPSEGQGVDGRSRERGFDSFGVLIREGIADGSLRPDLDPELTLHAVVNAVIGAQRRLASLGSKVELEYGHPVNRLFQETIRIILFGLRAVDSAGKAKKKSVARKRSL